MIAWTVEMTSACPPDLLPDTFWNFTNYKADSQELQLLPPDPIPGDTWSCFEKLESSNSSLDLRLVRVREGGQDCVGLRSCPGGKRVGCCSECAASPGPSVELRTLRKWSKARPFSFKYVGGSYALQLEERPCQGCEIKRSWCSAAAPLGKREERTDCLTEQAEVVSKRQEGESTNCTLHFSIALPLCTKVMPYSTVNITVFTAESNSSCDSASSVHHNSRHLVSPCSSNCGNRTSPSLAVLDFSFPADANNSYCLWAVPDSPACREAECGLPVDALPARCEEEAEMLRHSSLPMSEPYFILLVCSVLAGCLLFLFWVVVKCQREQGSPSCSPEPDMLKKTEMGSTMPRSLTIDEMEHICRLRQQEIVLVYFPDTEKFKNLNRMFKDWLQSLNILNVNHVTDIYDEKYADGQDGILKNPDTWVSNLLSDQERRVVLVTSRLAFECLLHLRKGLAPPPFPGDAAYSQLLVSMLATLDSDMFKGNYRRLICVRYEDLKICDRRYGSESFNIVPGTEYLLPQHLEDIARWIHPVEARPGLWAEHRPQVRALLECIKAYRHHEDNIFTVSFYTGREDGPLLSDVGGFSGY